MVKSHRTVEPSKSEPSVLAQSILYAWRNVRQSGKWVFLVTKEDHEAALPLFTSLVAGEAKAFSGRTALAEGGGKLSLVFPWETPPKETPFSVMFLGWKDSFGKGRERWRSSAQDLLQYRVV